VCLCRRAWRRRHPARAGGRDRAAVWRAIPASATTAPASPGETHPPSLNGEWRRVLFARSFWNAKVFERTGSAGTNLPIDSPSRTAAYAFKPCSWARLIAALLFCQRGLRVAEPSRGLGRTTRRCGGQTVRMIWSGG
jgi:hypothetical protein